MFSNLQFVGNLTTDDYTMVHHEMDFKLKTNGKGVTIRCALEGQMEDHKVLLKFHVSSIYLFR